MGFEFLFVFGSDLYFFWGGVSFPNLDRTSGEAEFTIVKYTTKPDFPLILNLKKTIIFDVF